MPTSVAARPRPSVHPSVASRSIYPRAGHARVVSIGSRRVLAIAGEGEPGGPAFQEAMGAVYTAAYALHFRLRQREVDTHVPPPECLWTRKDGVESWSEGEVAFDPSAWRWTLLMAVPEEADKDDLAAALEAVARRRPAEVAARLQVRTIHEGLVVEAMHVGPYDTEPATIATMHRLATGLGLEARGAHHEIYLGDPRRCAPENLRTVLRQPVH